MAGDDAGRGPIPHYPVVDDEDDDDDEAATPRPGPPPEADAEPEPEPPALTAAEGAALQSSEVADFLDAAVGPDREPLPKPPHRVVIGPPGLGKTKAWTDGQI